ncbi:MAG: hypothetical protein AAGJ82_07340 [Bacteroidota bacterium]
MKNFTLTLEGWLLICLLVLGLGGACMVLQNEEASPELASPRQEAPAMVHADPVTYDQAQTLPR